MYKSARPEPTSGRTTAMAVISENQIHTHVLSLSALDDAIRLLKRITKKAPLTQALATGCPGGRLSQLTAHKHTTQFDFHVAVLQPWKGVCRDAAKSSRGALQCPHMNKGQMEGSVPATTQVMTSLLLRCSRKKTTCLARMQGACGLRKQGSADNNSANQPFKGSSQQRWAHRNKTRRTPTHQAE